MGYISLRNVPFAEKVFYPLLFRRPNPWQTRQHGERKQFSKFGAKGFGQLTADKHQQEVEADFTDAEQRALKHIYTHAHEHIPDAMAPLSQMELAAAILDIVPQMDAEVVTIRIIMQKLATRFGVEFETIRKQKAEIKALVMTSYGSEQHQETEEEQRNSDNGSNAEKENVENASKRGRAQESPVKRKPARKSNAISDESDEEDASEQEDEEEEEDGDDSKSQASDSENDVPKRKSASSKSTPAKRKTSASKREKASKKKSTPPAKKPRQTASTDSPGIAALKDMARAARLLSPRVYASLKKLDSAEVQEEFIRDMLHNNGIKFSGRYPHKREVDDVRRKKDLEKDLEGIDTSLIIEDTSSRSRRSSRSAVSYADQLRNRALSDEEEDEEEEDGEEEEKEEEKEGEEDDSPKAKKPAPKRKVEEESEDDDDAFEANDSDSSEAEF